MVHGIYAQKGSISQYVQWKGADSRFPLPEQRPHESESMGMLLTLLQFQQSVELLQLHY